MRTLELFSMRRAHLALLGPAARPQTTGRTFLRCAVQGGHGRLGVHRLRDGRRAATAARLGGRSAPARCRSRTPARHRPHQAERFQRHVLFHGVGRRVHPAVVAGRVGVVRHCFLTGCVRACVCFFFRVRRGRRLNDGRGRAGSPARCNPKPRARSLPFPPVTLSLSASRGTGPFLACCHATGVACTTASSGGTEAGECGASPAADASRFSPSL